MGSCRFRTDLKASLAKEQAGTTARSNSADVQLSGLDTDTSRFALMSVFPVSTVTRNIGRCPSHVKANHGLAELRGQRIPHHTSSRARENRIAALKTVCSSEATIRLHEEQAALFQPIQKTRAETI